VKEELRRRMHGPIPDHGQWLARVVRGYFAYQTVPTNARSLTVFHHHVGRLWLRALKGRGQRDASTGTRIAQLAAVYLPTPRILHPWPETGFTVMYPRWEPST
jgi:hypothetical protein